MQAIVFIGIQATGKSSFYRDRFFDTHVRVSMDMLRTRHRERLLFEACLRAKQRVVVDNTNPTRAARERYLQPAGEHGFERVGYYFESSIEPALARNRARTGSARIPDKGVLGTYGQLERPATTEGFDALFFVRLTPGGFDVEPWRDEP